MSASTSLDASVVLGMVVFWVIIPSVLKVSMRSCCRWMWGKDRSDKIFASIPIKVKTGYVGVETDRWNETFVRAAIGRKGPYGRRAEHLIIDTSVDVERGKYSSSTRLGTLSTRTSRGKTWLVNFFDVGVWIALLCSSFGLVLLSASAWKSISAVYVSYRNNGGETSNAIVSGTRESAQIMLPMIPGVTVPWMSSYVVPLGLSLLISIGWHECGHALASAIEGYPPLSVGIFCMAPFMCGAYVKLSSEIQHLAPWSRLRIWSAGIWNNVVLCLILSLLSTRVTISIVQYLSMPLYSYNNGAVLLEMSSSSPFAGFLDPSSQTTTIVGLAEFDIRSSEDWYKSIRTLSDDDSILHNNGFCISPTVLRHSSTCCDHVDNSTMRPHDHDICFLLDGPEHHDVAVNRTHADNYRSVCATADTIAKYSQATCASSIDCRRTDVDDVSEEVCIVPRFVAENSQNTLLWIDVSTEQVVRRLMYAGSAQRLWWAGTFGDSLFRFRAFFPFFLSHSIAMLPLYAARLFSFAWGISATLALINAVPMYSLDGQYIYETVFIGILSQRGPLPHKWFLRIYRIALVTGTTLVGFSALLSISYVAASLSTPSSIADQAE